MCFLQKLLSVLIINSVISLMCKVKVKNVFSFSQSIFMIGCLNANSNYLILHEILTRTVWLGTFCIRLGKTIEKKQQ